MSSYPELEERILSNRTYTLSISHIGKLSELSERLSRNQSELVREAIDDLHLKYEEDPENDTEKTT